MMNINADLTECELLKIFKQLDGREKIDDLKKLISKLESMIEKGQGNVCIRAMVRSKKNELNRRLTGTPTSTPPESEDEDEDELGGHYVLKLNFVKICFIFRHFNRMIISLITLFLSRTI